LDADVRATSERSHRWTPLHYAARYGNDAVVELLLKHGAPINKLDTAGMTPLHCAAAHGCASAVTILLSHGA
ncbi:ankyrin, partial [Schizophyllum commune H4-8]|uniref:ankyrin n=1 Tax=Schizophyllum commune (strain H4-8 / FGSC 9210) TaxID=578458 RepID=UPI0021606586